MPKGPRGEKRSADMIGATVKVKRTATGEEQEELQPERPTSPATELGRRGGAARARKLTPEQRTDIARKAAVRRWKSQP